MAWHNIRSIPGRFAIRPLWAFAAAVLVLLLIGDLLFGGLREGIKQEAQHNIASVGMLKASLIREWLDDRSSDAGTLSEDSFFSRELASWERRGGRDAAERAQLADRLRAFMRGHHYRAIVVYDTAGRAVLGVGDVPPETGELEDEVRGVAASGTFRLIDLHRSADATLPVVLGFMNPLRDGTSVAGVIYLVEDPARYLFPLVNRWPGRSESAETQLVRKDGDRVLFLDQLRHRPEPPLDFSLPLDTPDLAAALALRGKRGLLEDARDYRGKPVLSYAAPIEGTPWVLVTKIDEDEAYGMVDKMRGAAAFVAIFIFGLIGAWFWQWFRREQATVDAAVLDERVRANALQLESEKRFRMMFEHTALPMVRNSIKGEFLEVNDAWCEMFGYSREEALERHLSWQEVTHPDDVPPDAALVGRLLAGEIEDIRAEKRYIRKDGEVLWGSLQVSLARDEQGKPEYLISAVQDITERKRAEEQISFMAYHDKLTGLPNRALLFDRLSQAMSQAKRDNKYAALMFIDLDGFKTVNDRYGHEAGDAVLRMVAQRFLSCVRAVDTVARFGGDEFAVVLGNLDDPQQARGVAEKVVQASAPPLSLPDGIVCRVGASVGISIYPEHGVAMDSLMTAADHAMYGSKTRGKSTYTFYQEESPVDANPLWLELEDRHRVGVEELDAHHRHLVRLGNRLNEALKRDEPAERIVRMFDELLAAVDRHFETEDRFMTDYHYPERSEHEADHVRLMNEALHLKGQFSEGRELSAMHSLKEWLLNHIAYEDRKLAEYLKKRGVK